MAQIKTSSTIQANKQTALNKCPVTYVMDKIGGYWKPIILFHLFSGPKRYSELRKLIPAVTEKMLIQHLKQLEEDDIVLRTARPVVPPYVTYSLAPAGLKLKPVLYQMAVWGFENSRKNGKAPYKNLANFPAY